MKNIMTFVILAIISIQVLAQDAPSLPPSFFVVPVRNEASTNQMPASELLQAVRSALSNNVSAVQSNVLVTVASTQRPRTNVEDRLGNSYPDPTNSVPAISQEEKERREKAESLARLLALNAQVQAGRRQATNATATVAEPKMVVTVAVTNQVQATNVTVKVTKPKKADKNAPPPVSVATPQVTVTATPEFDYTQVATNRYGDGSGEAQRYAIGGIQWTDPNAVYVAPAPESYPAQSVGYSAPPLNTSLGPTYYQQSYYSTPYYGYEYGSAFQFTIGPSYWSGYGPSYYNRPNHFNYGYRPHPGARPHIGPAPRPNHNVPVPGARPHPGGFPTGGAQIGPGGSPPVNSGAVPRQGAPPAQPGSRPNLGPAPRQGAPPSNFGSVPRQGSPPSSVGQAPRQGALPRQGSAPSGGARPNQGSGPPREGSRPR